jgi:hypothetical protein
MTTVDLIAWLRDIDDFDDGEAKIFNTQKITGKRFLRLPQDAMIADGIPRGVAMDLVEIIQGLNPHGGSDAAATEDGGGESPFALPPRFFSPSPCSCGWHFCCWG